MDADLPPMDEIVPVKPAAGDDFRVVVFSKPGDPHLIGAILCDVLHESGTDAVIHAHYAPGVLPVPVTQEQAARIVTLIQGLGIQAAMVPQSTLPRFDEAETIHHARCPAEGWVIINYRGDVAVTIPWTHIDLIAIGDVPLAPTTRVLDSGRPLVTAAPPHPATALQLPTKTGPELWVIRRDPLAVYHIEHRVMNYEMLGDRMSQSATANFRLFAEELTARAAIAWKTPSTRAYLAHGPHSQYEFRTSDDLQRQALLFWVMEQRARSAV